MSDGPHDMARLERAEALKAAGLPSGGAIGSTADGNDAHATAIQAAARRVTGLIDAARVLLVLSGGALGVAGVPLGATAADLARAALDAATEPRRS